MPENIIPFELPKRKPRVVQQDAPPDQRKVAVIPIRACTDRRLTEGMIRALILMCSYCNRAGITWVSQKLLAERLGVSQQAVSKHLVKLQAAGYLEIHKRAVPGERHTTWRVIFDPSIKVEDAVAITSAIEDTRPPYMKREQEQAMQDQTPDPEGQRRIAQMVAKALKKPVTKKEYAMPRSGETRAVRQIKEANQKALRKRTQTQPPEVVQQAQPQTVDNSVHAQPKEGETTTSRGCTEHMNKGYTDDVKDKNINKLNIVLNNQELFELIETGLTEAEIAEDLDILLPLFQAEGLSPSSRVLADSILQMHRDAR